MIEPSVAPSQVRDRIRWLGVFARLLSPVLAAFLLFDRAAAYLHIPGTQLYLAEALLVVGVVAALRVPQFLRVAVRDDPLLCIVVAYCTWGLIRALPNVGTYGATNTIHDSSLWYYALFGILVVAAILAFPELPFLLAGRVVRFAPWLLGWLPFAVILGTGSSISLHVPFASGVSVLSHKDGNAAVAAFIALAALCLIPSSRLSSRSRRFWALIALATMVIAGTQNRGGFVAASVACTVGLLLVRGFGRAALIGILTVALAGVVVAFTLQPSRPTHAPRSVSATQFLANLESVAGVNNGLQATESARQRQWTYVIDQERQQGKIAYGWGSGPNLGFGQVTGTGNQTLRVPHNSHVDVLARLGLIGLGLWIALWLAWSWRLLAARRRFLSHRHHSSARIIDVCFLGAIAILVNAFFDPSLESGQVAVLLWTIFGVGAALSNPRWARLIG